ncbi:hypothetical protein MJO28_013650 [Puccinia striiformis f. sp. tritici]|uniref:Uncharacterized protein n=1 Tax=Puccinia striiformis f. sp. tritici TaxID=168172 RepID=A0ACC0DX20_9BASI|nr:hypothetical protein Pst134EA_025848 [Puccinia striiformis f. sp. tritici]KAH9451909.1 hypothetical protein Pst134EA_025848 [Puccinia striiformis f. sp. tritici]KAI7939998.1 hypothetical protein MJO28_013650 [Puccinia striiformis f. sp. tritici]KAI9615106.1 hypothetical protein H4Q26_011645 [Puccinia striiformis f. sp. tritici PST-130]
MSKKTAASPLLIRQRYQNPFPPPPFPPKLLHISTDPSRYAGYRFLRNLEKEREVPVISDADLGIPIELGIEADGTYGLGAYWEGDRAGICPEPNAARALLDPEDLALLAEPPPAPGSSISITNGSSQNQTLTVQGASHPSASGSGSSIPSSVHIPDRRKTEVSWLRRTEYFNDVQHKSRDSINNQKSRAQVPVLPKTKTERLAEIHSTFDAIANAPIQTLKHPTKPHLKAVEAFDLLPNESNWANTYDFYRFQENPTDRPDQSSSMSNLPDVRLEHAIIRPMTPKVGGPRLAYFLPESSDGVKNYKRIKEEKKMIDEEDQADEDIKDGDPEAAPEPVNELRFVRDYEISQQRPLNQYLLIFDDGQASGRRKAAYFNPVGNFRTLRKRRPKPNEPAQFDGEEETPWDGISVLLSTDPGAISSIKAVRKELLAPVSQPSGL